MKIVPVLRPTIDEQTKKECNITANPQKIIFGDDKTVDVVKLSNKKMQA